MKLSKSLSFVVLLLILASMILSACGPSSSSASCTYIVGDGYYDKNVHNIIYPGQTMPESLNNEITKVAPCNYRNYIVTDGSIESYGDRQTPIYVVFNGTRLEILASAFWMLNQNVDAMREFYVFADKYDALNTTEDKTGNVNSSTPGWNSMLRENFGPTMDAITKQAIYNINNDYDNITGETLVHEVKITDAIWQNEDPMQVKELQDEMSRIFQHDVRKRIGSVQNLFCGSGAASKWADPDLMNAGKPGNTFNCDPVRVEVNAVRRADKQDDTGAQSIIEANRSQYQSAYELYHDQTDCWLGIQNSIRACAETGATCVINIDASSCNVNNADGTKKETTIVLPNPPTPTPAVP